MVAALPVTRIVDVAPTRFDTLINGVRAVNEVQSTAVAEEKIRCIVGRACLSKRQSPTI